MKLKRIVAAVVFLISLSLYSLNVSAEIQAGSYSLSPHIGGYEFNSGQNLDDGTVFGLGFGYNYTKEIGVEAVFDFIDTHNTVTGKTEAAHVLRIDGLYHFMTDKKFVPYVAAGLGVIDLNQEGDDTNGMFDYGAGVKYFLSETLAIRGDVRQLVDFDDANDNISYTLGLDYIFGKKAQAPPAAPMDSDGDGVYDDMDKCPDTPAGAPVNKDGCPLDSDGDGVYDYKDRCPNTPAGAPVNMQGCPLDSDGDGVYDFMDKCPGTLKGIKVDMKGCPVPIKEKVSINLNVEFDTNSAIVKNKYHDHIMKVANFLKTYPKTNAEIEGHTDNDGDAEVNRKLSQDRANHVARHLMEYGVDRSRITAIGYGESRPIADNSTMSGKKQNRRVIAVISTIVTR